MNTQRQYTPSVLEQEVKILLEKGLISKDIFSAARFEQEQRVLSASSS